MRKSRIKKLLLLLKRTWYFVLIGAICFSLLGFLYAKKKSINYIESSKIKASATIIITDGKMVDVSQQFSRLSEKLLQSNDLKKTTISNTSVCNDIDLGYYNEIISVVADQNICNLFTVNINYKTNEDAKLIFDNYLIESEKYLNRNILDNLKEDGTFKEGVSTNNTIRIRQISEINYKKLSTENNKLKQIKYSLAGFFGGIIISLIAIYFLKFYFIIHDKYAITKNYNLEQIAEVEGEENLKKELNNLKDKIVCVNNKKLICNNNCALLNDLIENKIEKKEIIIVIQKEKDTFFYIEKALTLFKNYKIKGYILYQ